VVSLDTNERQNRVKIGLNRTEVQAEVERRLTALRVPLDAVVFEQQSMSRPYGPDPMLFTRPVVGGLQIRMNGGTRNCSIGFLVRRSGVNGFVTASHCTTGIVDAKVTGTIYDQPAAAGGANRVGTEIVDPPFFTTGNCPSGRKCRFSDSIFAAISGNVTGHIGQIIHPDDPNFPGNFSILDHSVPLSGENVAKVGGTTGLTAGEISDTSVDLNQALPNGAGDSGVTLLAQNRVKAFSAPGDSGSPVFTSTKDPYQVFLAGILWGGPLDGSHFDYSPFQLVQEELGLGFEFTDSDQAPTVTITNPPNNATVPYGALTSVRFEASAGDFEQGPTCCTFTWESDKDGPMGAGATLDYFFFTPGDRSVTVTATDGSGNKAIDFIRVHTGNNSPMVWILNPTVGATLIAGSSYLLEGGSFDPERFRPLPCANLTWSSNSADPAFPQTGCSPQVSFATAGQRTIILTGNDPDGGSPGVATVKVNVVPLAAGSPPVVSILSPTLNQVVGPTGTGPITLKGIAAAVDGKPVSYRWMLQGNPPQAIGQGSASNNQPFTTSWNPTPQQLPFGCGGYTFTIRLEATDSGNAIGSDSVPAYVPFPVC
jgi:hypothetical protein